MDFEKIIDYALQNGVSDIHLTPGNPVFFRRNGSIESVGENITVDQINNIAKEILNPSQQQEFTQKRQLDFLHQCKNGQRVRGNAFFCDKGIGFAFRVILQDILSFDDLGFPDFVNQKILNEKNGLIMIVGPTGQGKSTTLASALQKRMNLKNEHLIMLEEPIEYLLNSKQSIIQQREVGRDVKTFHDGMIAAMREDPDVIMVGELREKETMASTLNMAETGHLVFGTLHTSNAVQTITRFFDSFLPDQQPQIRGQLADNLKMVISQRLIPKADGNGRVLAYEVFTMNYAIQNYIRQNQVYQITNVIQADSSGSMVSFEQSLVNLVASGTVTKEIAMEYAMDKNQMTTLFDLNDL